MKSVNKNIIISVAISAIVFGGVGYYVGKGSASSSSMRMPGAQMGNGAMRGGFARGGANGGVISGDIVSADDSSLTVKTRDGGSRVVLLTSGTKVAKQVDGVKSDVKQGVSVMIIGTQNSDGSVTAETVQIRPAGFGTSTGMMR